MAPTMHRLVGMGVPSKYFDFPVASLGREETVTLKRARRVRPQRTKKARKRVSSGVRRPRAKAETAGATPKDIYFVQHKASINISIPRFLFSIELMCNGDSRRRRGKKGGGVVEFTKSANESNSWPIRLLFFLHRATLPSIKSKNRPKGMKARAIHIVVWDVGGPRQ
ncbi:MAG: hypothetical protein Q9188_003370 [Gyalolechia gomerana]